MNATVRIIKSNIEYDVEYTYKIPAALEPKINVGVFVLVPFGGGDREETGIVTRISADNDNIIDKKIRLKSIIGKNENYEPLNDEQMRLAEMIAKRYASSFVEAARIMMSPVKNRELKVKYVSLSEELTGNPEKIREIVTGNTLKNIKQIDAIKAIAAEPDKKIEQSILTTSVDITPAMLKTLEKKGFVKISECIFTERIGAGEEMKNAGDGDFKTLNEEQNNVKKAILELLDKNVFSEYLLHGITGSGKTEVYLHVIKEVLERGGGAMLLVPEIALTTQMIKRVTSRFGDTVAIIHSRLTPNEKAIAHEKLRTGRAKICLGVRSAVFATVRNLKLIIVDEEQEPSYKSFESLPYYNATEVAAMRMEMAQGVVIYGSATPRISTYYRALTGEIGYGRMETRATNSLLPNVMIIDMKEEQRAGNMSPISAKLREELAITAAKNEQAIVFVPRRGFSAKLTCLSCGKTIACRHCFVPMSYHKAADRVVCHYCGNTGIAPKTCPYCNSKNLTSKTYGTEMIEAELRNIFPDKDVIRMDSDTTRVRDGHEKLLERFEKEHVPFLVGTQMITKGLDFPDVTLVGVIGADSLLSVSEYDAAERAFVLLTQVFGRAGRAEGKRGRAILQVMNTDNHVYADAISQDYFKFYESEISYRKALGFPPFGVITTVTATSSDDREAFDVLTEMRVKLEEIMKKAGRDENAYDVMAVSRCALPKLKDHYRWQFIMREDSPENAVNVMNIFREEVLTPYARKLERKKYTAKVYVNVDIDMG